LSRRNDPQHKVSPLGLPQQLRRCVVTETRHVNEQHGRTPFQFEPVFSDARGGRHRSHRTPRLLCQRIHQARFSGIDLADQNDPHRPRRLRRSGGICHRRGAQLFVRQGKPARVEVDGGAADGEHELLCRPGANYARPPQWSSPSD
jgi:hypothetical protein